ncbi:MAG TPA: c-type cytochrome [Acidobacteriaceae bacterium]|nr:c-type cytochrome [Acidobacteriaceae bacterium]
MLNKNLLLVFTLFLCASAMSAQSGQWMTYGHDPQRSGFAADEHAFSPSNVSSLGLKWKTIVPNEPLVLTGLSAPLIVRGVKSENGTRNLVLVAGSSDHIFALDADTGALAWKRDFSANQARPEGGDWLCPFALNDTPVIDPAKSRVFVIASDGRLHILNLSDGEPAMPPAQFAPAYAKTWSLNYAGGVLYSSISQGCNHSLSGVLALDPDEPGRPVVRFYSAVNGGAGVWGLGGPSVDFAGFIYGMTGDAAFEPAANEFGDTILKLSPHTLRLEGYYTPATWQYLTRHDLDMGASTPVIFRWHGRVLSAVGGKEGAIYVTDTGTMADADHHVAAYISPRYTNEKQTFESNGIWGEMTVWKDPTGETWLYVPSWGVPTEAAKFPTSYGSVTHGSMMAFQVVSGADHKPILQPAWISSDIAVPDPAAIAGGVLFVLGTGENTEQVLNGNIGQLLEDRESRATGHAILYALDARTGKQLWTSGDSITGWTHFSGLAIGDGKVFATTRDGAVYAFGLRAPGEEAARVTVVPAPPRAAAVTSSRKAAAISRIPECGVASSIFKQRCAMCHGPDGRGAISRTPNFADSAWQSTKSDKALLDAVTNGTEGGMPAFGNQLSSEQIDRLVHCVVRGFAGSPQSR